MQYYEVTFRMRPCNEVQQDVLCALLGEVGFETFESTDDGVRAWIQRPLLDENSIRETLRNDIFAGTEVDYDVQDAPDEDWNRTWEEEGFKPIIIDLPATSLKGGDTICIHDVKHADVPDCRYDILINPCQAFGTGSHETTRMLLQQLAQMSLRGLDVIDAGTGTGILSIMCSMLGAKDIFAYDIDEWSVNNTRSNLKLNNINNVYVALGDSGVLASHRADILIANINRNILLGDMERFATALNDGGRLLLSGFYQEDVPVLLEKAGRYGLYQVAERHDGEWTMLYLAYNS